MITNRVIQRTFHIRHGSGTGTAFAFDRDRRQYLITARHVVENLSSGNSIEVFHDKKWKELPVDVLGLGSEDIDVAVLSAPVLLAEPSLRLEAGVGTFFIGQQVFFTGFPFGWDSGGGAANQEFPICFVKSGIVSSVLFDEDSRMFIDAHGNPGFSGGPVVFSDPGGPGTELQVAGVVANAPTPRRRPVVDEEGAPLVVDGDKRAYFWENQGFVVAVNIRHALEMIDANPIGFSLPPEEAG